MTNRLTIHRLLAVHSSDRILHHIAPLGLASSIGRCVVVDLDPVAPGLSTRTLAQILAEGATAVDLDVNSGVSVIGNGGVTYDRAAELVEYLAGSWGRVVLRVPGDGHPFRTLQVEPILPAPFTTDGADVVQATRRGQRSDRPLILPALRRHQIRSMLSGTIEPRWRWTASWRPAWSRSWE